MATEQYRVDELVAGLSGNGQLTFNVTAINGPVTPVDQITVVDNSSGVIPQPSGSGLDICFQKKATVFADANLYAAVAGRQGSFVMQYYTQGGPIFETVSGLTLF